LFIINISYSQDIAYGLKAGMNVTNLGKSGYQSRVGYHLGGTAEFITTPFFSVQTELLYSLQGAAIDITQNIFLNYHYLNVPLLGKVYFYEDASFELGMQYGFLLSANQKNELFKENITEQVKRNDFSLVFGLNYLLNDKFNFGIRYNLGITNTQMLDVIYEQRVTNRVLQISCGLVF